MVSVTAVEHATKAEIELAEAIVVEHQAAQRAWEDAVTHAIECGRLLLHAKETVGHGGWMEWLDTHFPASVRTAQNYMRLARHEANAQAAAHLGVDGALRTLAQPRQLEHETDSADGDDPKTTRPGRKATMTDIVRVVAKLGPQAARKPLEEDWWRNRQFGHDRAKLLEIGLIAALVDISPIVVPVDSAGKITWVWVGYLADDELVYHPGWFSYSKKFVAGDKYRALIEEMDEILNADTETDS